jgi:hypothetical protein
MLKYRRASGSTASWQKRTCSAGLSEMAPYSPHARRLQRVRSAMRCSGIYAAGSIASQSITVTGFHWLVSEAWNSFLIFGLRVPSSSGKRLSGWSRMLL